MQMAVLSREEKGRIIAEKPNQIQRMDERCYKVASQNGHGIYDVIRRENGSWICNCVDFHYRAFEQHQIVRCKHIIAVQVTLRFITTRGSRANQRASPKIREMTQLGIHCA